MSITVEEITKFTKRVNSLVITTRTVSEMHRKLNTLITNSSKDWQLLRNPMWRNGYLVAVVIKPDPEVV